MDIGNQGYIMLSSDQVSEIRFQGKICTIDLESARCSGARYRSPMRSSWASIRPLLRNRASRLEIRASLLHKRWDRLHNAVDIIAHRASLGPSE